MNDTKLILWKLAEKWSMPFLASWRTFEATLNPAFDFLVRCNNCGKVGESRFVPSVKSKTRLIGIQCTCGQTIKFEKPIDVDASDFPNRLHFKPQSALETPDGKEAEEAIVLDDVMQILF